MKGSIVERSGCEDWELELESVVMAYEIEGRQKDYYEKGYRLNIGTSKLYSISLNSYCSRVEPFADITFILAYRLDDYDVIEFSFIE